MNKVIYAIMATAIIASAVGLMNLPADSESLTQKDPFTPLNFNDWSYCMNKGKPSVIDLTEIAYLNPWSPNTTNQSLRFRGNALNDQFILKTSTYAKQWAGSKTTEYYPPVNNIKAGPYEEITEAFSLKGTLRAKLTMDIHYYDNNGKEVECI